MSTTRINGNIIVRNVAYKGFTIAISDVTTDGPRGIANVHYLVKSDGSLLGMRASIAAAKRAINEYLEA